MAETKGLAYAAISIDLDPLVCYQAIFGRHKQEAQNLNVIVAPATAFPMLERCFERWLDLLHAINVRATFFVVGNTLASSTMVDLAHRALKDGHELANHTMSHPYNLRSLSKQHIHEEIASCDLALRELAKGLNKNVDMIAGSVAFGFRTPGYHSNANIHTVLKTLGYTYDSSSLVSWSYYLIKCLSIAKMRLAGTRSVSQLASLRIAFSQSPHYTVTSDVGVRQIPISTVSPAQLPLCPYVIGRYRHWHRNHRDVLHINAHAIDLADRNDPGIDDWLRKHLREIKTKRPIRQKILEENITAMSHMVKWQPLVDVSTRL